MQQDQRKKIQDCILSYLPELPEPELDGFLSYLSLLSIMEHRQDPGQRSLQLLKIFQDTAAWIR